MTKEEITKEVNKLSPKAQELIQECIFLAFYAKEVYELKNHILDESDLVGYIVTLNEKKND